MNNQTLKRLEWSTAILLTLTILVLLFVRAAHAGALWRDEYASVQVALLPTFSDVLKNFQRESFPAFFYATLRGYAAVFGTSDAAFRALGFVVGLMLIGVAWINARRFGHSPPLVCLALLGLSTTFLIWGTSIRGYGLGSVFNLLAFGLNARMLVDLRRGRIIAAGLASVVSVQLLLYNSVLLLAIGVGFVAVCFFRRNRKPVFVIAGVGFACAVSVWPYFGPFWKEREFTIVFQGGSISPAWFWERMTVAFGEPSSLTTAVWVALFTATVVGAALRLRRVWPTKPSPEWDLLLFGLVVFIVSIIAYFAFLNVVGYGTREWYYLALLSILAGTIDLMAATLSELRWMRLTRLAVVIVALIGMPFAAWPKVTERHTNLDAIARKLEQTAQPHDLIVVNPWFFGVGFNWYYHGSTRWVTVPAMRDHRMHRFDLLKEKMMSANAIDDLSEMIGDTLQSGDRVWFVGGIKLLHPNEAPLSLSPAPNSEFGWSCNEYSQMWSEQLGIFLQMHARKGQSEHVVTGSRVNTIEDVALVWFEGSQ